MITSNITFLWLFILFFVVLFAFVSFLFSDRSRLFRHSFLSNLFFLRRLFLSLAFLNDTFEKGERRHNKLSPHNNCYLYPVQCTQNHIFYTFREFRLLLLQRLAGNHEVTKHRGTHPAMVSIILHRNKLQ